jgi:hypothetical protein
MAMRLSAFVLTCVACVSHALRQQWLGQDILSSSDEEISYRALSELMNSRTPLQSTEDSWAQDLASILLAINPAMGRQASQHTQAVDHLSSLASKRHEDVSMFEVGDFVGVINNDGGLEEVYDAEIDEISGDKFKVLYDDEGSYSWETARNLKARSKGWFEKSRRQPEPKEPPAPAPAPKPKREPPAKPKREPPKPKARSTKASKAEEEEPPAKKQPGFAFPSFGKTEPAEEEFFEEPEPEKKPPFAFPSFGGSKAEEAFEEPEPEKKQSGFAFPSFGAPAEPSLVEEEPEAKKSPGFAFPSFGAPAEEPVEVEEKKEAFSFPSFPSFGGDEAPAPPEPEKPRGTPEIVAPAPPPPAFQSPAPAPPPEPEPEQLPDDAANTGVLVGAGIAGATIGGFLTDAVGVATTGELVTDAAVVGAVALGGATVYAATRPDDVGEAARFVGRSVSDTATAYGELAAVNAELAVLEQRQKAQAAIDEKVDEVKAIPGQIVAAPQKAANALKSNLKNTLTEVQSSAQKQVEATKAELDKLGK